MLVHERLLIAEGGYLSAYASPNKHQFFSAKRSIIINFKFVEELRYKSKQTLIISAFF